MPRTTVQNSDFDLGKVVILQRFRGQKQLLIITIIIFLNVIDKYTLYFTLIICSIVIGQYNLTVGYRMEHLQSISYTLHVSTKFTNQDIDYSHFSSRFKGLTL